MISQKQLAIIRLTVQLKVRKMKDAFARKVQNGK